MPAVVSVNVGDLVFRLEVEIPPEWTFLYKLLHPLLNPVLSSESSSFKPLEKYSATTFPILRTESLTELDDKINEGFVSGFLPELCQEGAGGTYFLKDGHGHNVGVFKPFDEEPNSPNNPKLAATGPSPDVPTNGIKAGHGCLREVAAYTLDDSSPSFLRAGVPFTDFASVLSSNSSKFGSLQHFVEEAEESWNIGPSQFKKDDVQRLGLFDLRVLNTDRHGGNILVTSSNSLVPIDHAFSFPEQLDDGVWFEWMAWPQAKLPFSDRFRSEVASIDVSEDLRRLEQLGLSSRSVLLTGLSSMLVKRAVDAGLTLFEIGSLVCRKHPKIPSAFEALVHQLPQAQGCQLDVSSLESRIMALVKNRS